MITIKIILKVANSTPDRDVALLKAVRAASKLLLTQASLVQDTRNPRIEITAGDNFNAVAQLDLFDEQGTELDTELKPVRKPGDYGLSAIALNVVPTLSEDEEEYDGMGNRLDGTAP